MGLRQPVEPEGNLVYLDDYRSLDERLMVMERDVQQHKQMIQFYQGIIDRVDAQTERKKKLKRRAHLRLVK
jgi:hypothetical protein